MVHPLIYSNIRDPYFLNVHDLEWKKREAESPMYQKGSCSFLCRKKRQSCLFSQRIAGFTGHSIFPGCFLQMESNINITDRNYYFYWPQDVLNTTEAKPEIDQKHPPTRTQKLIKRLIFYLWFCLVLLPLANKHFVCLFVVFCFTSSK